MLIALDRGHSLTSDDTDRLVSMRHTFSIVYGTRFGSQN